MSYKRSLTQTPQSVRISPKQVKNAAGGYVFPIDDMARLERFLILGSLGGTYYVSEAKHTYQNLEVIQNLIDKDGFAVVDKAVEISDAGRAAKNDHAILVVAMAAAKAKERRVRWYAWAKMHKVCRTGTHFFQFIDFYRNVFGGKFGTVAKREVSKWMFSKSADSLAFQMLKYRNREGWSWRDVLRLVRPTPPVEHNALMRYIVDRDNFETREVNKNGAIFTYSPVGLFPAAVDNFEAAQAATSVREVVRLIENHNIPREFIPTQFLNEPKVWEAMLPGMPPIALIRNLGKMSSLGILGQLSENAKSVCGRLVDVQSLARNRVHPINVLVAMKQYESGHGLRGNLSWKANQHIVDALERAFYLCFPNVEPTGKNIYVGVDSSGSMQGGWYSGGVMGIEGFKPAEAAAAMGMVVARSEPWSAIYGFDDYLLDPGITAKTSLRNAYTKFSRGGSTDASIPFTHALSEKMHVDLFVVITDNETWRGNRHPVQALQQYRQRMNPEAKLMVLAVTATGYSICDPEDPRQVDVPGFDTSVPVVMNAMAKM